MCNSLQSTVNLFWLVVLSVSSIFAACEVYNNTFTCGLHSVRSLLNNNYLLTTRSIHQLFLKCIPSMFLSHSERQVVEVSPPTLDLKGNKDKKDLIISWYKRGRLIFGNPIVPWSEFNFKGPSMNNFTYVCLSSWNSTNVFVRYSDKTRLYSYL